MSIWDDSAKNAEDLDVPEGHRIVVVHHPYSPEKRYRTVPNKSLVQAIMYTPDDTKDISPLRVIEHFMDKLTRDE